MSELENKIPLPEKNTGIQKEFKATKQVATVSEAQVLFQEAGKRLLDVNNWNKVCGKASALFQLTDGQGIPIDGLPHIGNYLKIDIPGPGPNNGKGYDWVRIEAIDKDKLDQEDSEFLLMRVRPSARPGTSNEETAHFFSDKATSNFVVRREKNRVTSAVIGRNEILNAHQNQGLWDKIRNLIVGLSASLGLSTPQWQNLANGFLGL
ncbi:MAG: hypothetical protein NVS1B13_04650 [Flavisolibacter sp.]